jgi:pSer/pThr/pTyr-binding forkhead associated (FHA) protein
LDQVTYYLEKGGAELPDLVATDAPEQKPAEYQAWVEAWSLAAPGNQSPIPLTGTILIGRGDDCDLHLNDNRASRQHARIQRRQESFWIIDLDSTNGVFVNGARIQGSACLASGDQIQIGDTVLDVKTERVASLENATLTGLKRP